MFKSLQNILSYIYILYLKKKAYLKIKSPEYQNRYKNKNFLIIAGGPSVKSYEKEIIKLIDEKSCIVISVNNYNEILNPDYHMFSNQKRFKDYISSVKLNKVKLLLSPYIPKFTIKKNIKNKIYEEIMYLNNNSDFDIKNGIIQTNCRTVTLLAVGVSIVMGAKQIFIVGMDGYKNLIKSNKPLHYYGNYISNDKEFNKHNISLENLNEKFLKQINDYYNLKNKNDIKILTPTVHKNYYVPFENII